MVAIKLFLMTVAVVAVTLMAAVVPGVSVRPPAVQVAAAAAT